MWILIIQRLLIQFILDVLLFPFWWYTKGLVIVGKMLIDLFQDGRQRLSPGLWLLNLFVPMYGQTDWGGRLMSVFMRLVNVCIRSLLLLFWVFFLFILFIFWLVIPLFLLSQVISSFT